MLHLLFSLFFAAALSVTTRRCLTQLQLCSYKMERSYFKVFLTRYYLAICVVSAGCFALWYFGQLDYLIALLLISFTVGVSFAVRTKVRLKLTPRMKRLIATLFLTLFVGCYFLPEWAMLLPLPLWTLVAFCLTLPFEKLNNKKYIDRASAVLAKTSAKKVAIVGSFGKTSVKNILATLLGEKFKVQFTPNSVNTPIGIASFVNGKGLECDFFLAETGARRKGEIAELCRIIKPNYAIFTGVGECHLSTFGTIENIARTKREIFDYLDENSFCVVNCDNEYGLGSLQLGNCRKIPVTLDNSQSTDDNKACEPAAQYYSKIHLTDLVMNERGSSFVLSYSGQSVACSTLLLGRHNALNILLAVAFCLEMGMNLGEIAQGIAKIQPIPHRLQLIRGEYFDILDDSYNANSDGVATLADTLKCFHCNRAVITQGIVELGKHQFEANYSAAKSMSKSVEYAVIIGVNHKALRKGFVDGGLDENRIFHACNVNEGVEILKKKLNKGDLIAFQNDLPDNY